jgi:hypothetical protein
MRTGSICKGLAAFGLVASAWIAAGPAAAAVVNYVFEGHVTNGEEDIGVDIFGDLGSLSGRAAVLRTSFDLSSPSRLTQPYQFDGVGGVGATSPLLAASLTIGERTFVLPTMPPDAGLHSGLQLYYADPNSLQQQAYIDSSHVQGAPAIDLSVRLDSRRLPDGLDTPFDLTIADAGNYFGGSFYIGYWDEVDFRNYGAAGDLVFTHAYTVADVAPGPGVPEPATWAIMILGFGLAGATLRARRHAAAGATLAAPT